MTKKGVRIFEYLPTTITFCTALHYQFKCFNDELCQLPIAHSVFKQSVHSVIVYQLQQHTIEVCYEKIQLLCQ